MKKLLIALITIIIPTILPPEPIKIRVPNDQARPWEKNKRRN